MGNMQLIEIETGLLMIMILTFRRQCRTKIYVWSREEIYPSNTLGTISSSIWIFAKIKTWTRHNCQITYYNGGRHLHYGRHHHHHAFYITHEEQDGLHASGRITVTPHIWLSKLHWCNERRPTKLFCDLTQVIFSALQSNWVQKTRHINPPNHEANEI